MARKTAAQVREKYQRRMAASGQDYADGVSNPSVPWEEATRAAGQRWQVGVQEAMQEGRYERGVQGKQDKYNRKVQSVGVQRFQAAAQTAAEEYGRVAERVVSIGNAASERARQAPGATLEERLQKMRDNAMFIRDQWRNG